LILPLRRPQLATASLNFGVGRSRNLCVKSPIKARTPATQNFCQLLKYTKKYQSAFFTFVHKKSKDCKSFKNGCTLLLTAFLALLFIYFLHSVPGITHPGEKFPWRASGAAGGGGQP
jgi:hypothetical protein